MVQNLTRQGHLRAYHPAGRSLNAPRMYQAAQVFAYVEAKQDRNKIDLPVTYNKALQAEARAAVLEHRVEQLEHLLGLDVPRLLYNETAVRSLVSQTEEAVNHPPSEPEGLRKWARVLMAIHEEFFDLVERYTGNPKPWLPFARLARATRLCCPMDRMEELEYKQAYMYFDAAYKVFRQAANLHITERYGRSVAAEELPEEATSYLDRIIRHLPP